MPSLRIEPSYRGLHSRTMTTLVHWAYIWCTEKESNLLRLGLQPNALPMSYQCIIFGVKCENRTHVRRFTVGCNNHYTKITIHSLSFSGDRAKPSAFMEKVSQKQNLLVKVQTTRDSLLCYQLHYPDIVLWGREPDSNRQ